MGYQRANPVRKVSTDVYELFAPNQDRLMRYDIASANRVDLVAPAKYFYIYTTASGSSGCRIQLHETSSTLISANTNYDISLLTSGTGRLKYGTYNATGDVACNGYIEIKDSGGTTRKLMTTA